MIINTTKRDAMVLVFSMDVMKKNVSGTLRENYGIIKGKKMFKTYKSVIKLLEDVLIINSEEEDEKAVEIELEGDQFNMAADFIKIYLQLIEEKSKEEEEDIEKNAWFGPLQNFLYAMIIAESNEPVVV